MMMRRREFLWAALAAPAPQNKKRPPRVADVQVVRLTTVRQEGVIAYDGTVKITGDKPVSGLVLIFEFLATTKALLSMQKIEVVEGALRPGEEHSFQFQGNDVPRAVSFRVSAQDNRGRDLSLSGEGPYTLD
jgi:hypothetical protein